MDTPDTELQDLLESLDPTTRTLLAEVDLGQQAREFLHSDLGKHFVGCAHQEIFEAQTLLNSTSPWRRRRIQELQNRIWRANFLLSWLRELIVSGRSAEGSLHEGASDG